MSLLDLKNQWAPRREPGQVTSFVSLIYFWSQYPQRCLEHVIPIETHWVTRTSQGSFCYAWAFPVLGGAVLLGNFTFWKSTGLGFTPRSSDLVPSCAFPLLIFLPVKGTLYLFWPVILTSKTIRIQVWKRKKNRKWTHKSSENLVS